MKNYYSDYELEFYIESIDILIKEYNEKINMLVSLQEEFENDLKSRGRE